MTRPKPYSKPAVRELGQAAFSAQRGTGEGAEEPVGCVSFADAVDRARSLAADKPGTAVYVIDDHGAVCWDTCASAGAEHSASLPPELTPPPKEEKSRG